MTSNNQQIDLDAIEARAAHLYEYGDPTDTRTAGWEELAGTDVPQLVAEVRRLRAAMEQIRHLHKDSPMGPCPVCIDADAIAEGRDGLMPYPCPTGRLTGAQNCEPTAPAAVSAVVSPPTDRANLRERIADVLAEADGWKWVTDRDKARSSTYRSYQCRADAVLSVLGEPTDRAAEWHAAADALEAYIDRYRSPSISNWTGAVAFLRDRAVEVHGTGTPQPPVPQRAYPDCERCGDTGVDPERDGAEPCPECQQPNVPAPVAQQQPETEAHPSTVTWKIETPLRGEWRHTGATYDNHAWASERYQDAIENDPDREFRLVRATTTYTVEAEHNPDEPAPVAQQPAAEAWVCKCPAGLCGCGHHAPAEQQAAAADGEETPRTICVCGHTRGEHSTVSGRLLCDECDGLGSDACKEFEAL